MRKTIDPVDPEALKPAFKGLFTLVKRSKKLESFRVLSDYYTVVLDGTGYSSSEKVKCSWCLLKHHSKSGKDSYHHQMIGAVLVKPGIKKALPIAPKAILKKDGMKKNNCERNAAGRWIEKFRREHPKLKVIIAEDGLSSNAPHIKKILRHRCSYILMAKPGGHGFLFEQFDLAGKDCKFLSFEENGLRHVFEYVNNLSLNESNQDVKVNFLIYCEVDLKTNKERIISWVTDIPIHDENIVELMRIGRASWKIENETFNTLKNQGYHCEHNFGHGNENLSTKFFFLMMLAFLVDQILKMTDDIPKSSKKMLLFWRILSLSQTGFFYDRSRQLGNDAWVFGGGLRAGEN